MPKRWLCRCKEEENCNNQIVVTIILLIALITLVTQGEAEEVLKRSEESLHVVSSKFPFQIKPMSVQVCVAQEQYFNARLAVDLSTNLFSYVGR